MPQIDFYTNASDKLRTACVLSHKAMSSGHRVLIYLANAAEAKQLDDLLWIYPATAFMPHCLSDQGDSEQLPVILSHPGLPLPVLPILINLHPEIPPQFEQFQRVLEIVSEEESDSLAGRQRYRQYRELGYPLGHFDLRK